MLKQTWDRLGFYLGIALGVLAIANLLKHGLGVSLHGLPEQISIWYRLVFHGLADLLLFWLPYRIPLWIKDSFSVYVIIGFMCVRALSVQRTISFIDELAAMDFEIDMLDRLFRAAAGRIPALNSLPYGKARYAISRAMLWIGWPAVVPLLYRTWTKDARASMELSEALFRQLPFDRPKTAQEYAGWAETFDHAGDADSAMYIAIVERDGFALSLSISANLTFLCLIGFLAWSALAISP